MATEIVEIARTDTTVTLKANPSDTSNNNLYVWNTGDIAQEITTDKDQKILCFPCENSKIIANPYGIRSEFYDVFEEPYTPEKEQFRSSQISYRIDAITIITARLKINSEGVLIRTHPSNATVQDYMESFVLSTSGASGSGAYINYGWMDDKYTKKSETIHLPNFDTSKYHNYTLIYHKVIDSQYDRLFDIDFYVDDKRVLSQRSEQHLFLNGAFNWNYLPNCSYKFVRDTEIEGKSSIPEAIEYTQLTAYITASRNPVTVNVPSLSTSVLTCHVDGVIDRNQDKYSRYKEVLDSYIDCTGDYVKYIDANGTEVISNVPTFNNEYFLVDSDMDTGITIPNGNTSASGRFTEYNYNGSDVDYMCYLWEEDSQILSLGKDNPLAIINYGSLSHAKDSWNNPYSNVMKLIPIENGNKFVLKCSKFTSQEFDGFYKKHNYKIYFLQVSINLNYCVYDVYIDNIKAIFTTEEGETYPYIKIDRMGAYWSNMGRVTMNNFLPSLEQGSLGWIPNPTRFYSRKVYRLVKNISQEEYPELTYLWNTGETTKQITVQPTEPTTYSCTVTQGTRTANASILINATLNQSKPIAVISPQEKPYIEHMIGRFYATNSYDINDPVSPIVKYIWNDVETISPVFVTRVKRTDKIRLKVVNALGLVSDEVEVDLSKDTDQWGNKYKFLDIPMFLICSKGANLFDTLISRFPIPSRTLDLYSNFYPTEYDKYTSIGFTTDISTDTIRYMACLPHHGVAEYTANREQVDIYPLGISWLEKRNMIKYYNKVKGSKGSLLACIGHPELQEEGYGSLEFVLDALGIITPKERYTIPRLLDLLELLLMDYENGGLIKL